jgi:hypothetical protein
MAIWSSANPNAAVTAATEPPPGVGSADEARTRSSPAVQFHKLSLTTAQLIDAGAVGHVAEERSEATLR